jgi:chorismate dehydratase
LHANLTELNKKIRVGAVSYLNTKPFLHGIKQSGLMDSIELIEDYPSKIAGMLLNDEIDVGLVPVAILPNLKQSYIITDFCIGAEQEVASVALFSEVPLDQIETVLLDYQSRTSVNLAKILFKEYWKKDVVLKDAQEDFRTEIKGNVAGIVIGDRALEQRNISKYMYDLASSWIAHTGFPFVFAAWIANKPLGADFEVAFNLAIAEGIKHIDEVVAEQKGYTTYNLKRYYTENISYHLTDNKRKGLTLFLEKLKML